MTEAQKYKDAKLSIRSEFQNLALTWVVVDDDPTGTQTVHDVPVLGEWGKVAITKEFESKTPLFFILANTRSLNPQEATKRAAQIAENIKQAALITGRKFMIISRSDSTLRGYFPSESDTLALKSGLGKIPTLLIPAFFEGGRITEDDIHYLVENGIKTPVSDTPFAKDKTFGFQHSDLKKWILEKSHGTIGESQIHSITIPSIRLGVAAITNQLSELDGNSYTIVNCPDYEDLEKVSRAILNLVKKDKIFMFRTAASFVSAISGIYTKRFIPSPGSNKNGGLIIVGSHVPKTTLQINALRDSALTLNIEIEVEKIINDGNAEATQSILLEKIHSALSKGQSVMLYTSRKLITARSPEDQLELGEKITGFLVSVIRSLELQPSYLIAKGGITSNEIAVRALGMKKAQIKGQLMPGIPIWQLDKDSKFPDLHYIVFPGNVGGEHSLKEAVELLQFEPQHSCQN